MSWYFDVYKGGLRTHERVPMGVDLRTRQQAEDHVALMNSFSELTYVLVNDDVRRQKTFSFVEDRGMKQVRWFRKYGTSYSPIETPKHLITKQIHEQIKNLK